MHYQLITILFVLVGIQSFAQERKDTYSVIYSAKTALDTSKFKVHKAHVGMILKEIDNLELSLKIQDTLTVFEVGIPMGIDRKSSYFKKRARSFLLLREAYYTDLKNRKLFTHSIFNNEEYLIESLISKYEWQVSDESRIISGYTCYKASTIKNYLSNGKAESYKVVAWFCPDIPIEAAPKDYFGLPGMVFELSEADYIIYKLKSFDLDPDIEKAIVLPKATIMNPEEYDQIVSNAYSTIIERN